MATWLTITGAGLEGVGLAMVFAELALLRSHEFGVPTPWARLVRRVRRLLGRPHVIEVGTALSAESAVSARAKVRPGPTDNDATEAERIARLERYVDHLGRDVDELHRRIDDTAQELAQAAQEQEQDCAARWTDAKTRGGKHYGRPFNGRALVPAACSSGWCSARSATSSEARAPRPPHDPRPGFQSHHPLPLLTWPRIPRIFENDSHQRRQGA